MKEKMLVLGATGNVGRSLIKALLAKGETVIAASRSGKRVEGAEGVAIALANPTTLTPALEGIDRVYMMLPTPHPRSQMK